MGKNPHQDRDPGTTHQIRSLVKKLIANSILVSHHWSVNFLSANTSWKMKILTSLHSAFSIQGYQSFKSSEPSFGRNVSKQPDTAVANNWIFFQIESAFASNMSRERPACDTRATEETLENTKNSALFLSIST